ncbi:MAG: uracil-DNA glycosylase [Spartobacteria bacterium]|nr:uracil-DNA glycosylase [Spartobacteria bacterium]
MKKPLREQAVEYLQYLKEQGVTHVPSSGKKFAKRPPVSPTADRRPPTSDLGPRTSAAPPAPPPPPVARVPAKPPKGGKDTLESLAAEVAACQACKLAGTRTNTVAGEGCLNPDILFIGEGPGADEDEQGRPFVGRSGQLLTKMIVAMGYTREQVFIGNIVKCRPPGNRAPTPEEMAGCIPYLKRQIAVIKPKLIVCLGATAARGLVNETLPIGKARGQWREFEGIPVMLTFHPAYLLRDPRQKAPCWSDLKAVLARLGKQPPGKEV